MHNRIRWIESRVCDGRRRWWWLWCHESWGLVVRRKMLMVVEISWQVMVGICRCVVYEVSRRWSGTVYGRD
ncbi:hypothetical protein BDZ91DRAFT_742533, partial [Kalaharituber pfeilii]